MKEKKKDFNENKDINEKTDETQQVEVKKEAKIADKENKFKGVKDGWKYYRYKGPSTGITLKYQSEDYEIILLSNNRVLLPEKHPYTQKMLFNGFLMEL